MAPPRSTAARRALPILLLLLSTQTALAQHHRPHSSVPRSTIAKAARALAEPWHTSFPRQWDLREQQLGAVAVNGVPLFQSPHGPLIKHRARLLSPVAAARGIAGHLGPANSLRRFLHHAAVASAADNDANNNPRHRPPLRIGVVGGSISWGSAVKRGVEDWPSLVTTFLNQYYPNANISLTNGCVPATPASFTSACLQNLVPQDADLVFVEFAVNESGAGEKQEPSADDLRRAAIRYERLLRKLLSLPRRPAVVLLHLPAVGMTMGLSHPWCRQYNQTAEDHLATVGDYYDAPSVSLRKAIWRLARQPDSRHAMNFTDFFSDTQKQPYDFIHPLGPGHRAIADLVLHALGEVALGLTLRPWSADLLEGGGGADGAEALAPLPPPLHANNLADKNLACAHGSALSAHVESAEGFDLIDEGKAPKQKVGYVAWRPGARLVLRVDLKAAEEAAAEEEEGAKTTGSGVAVQLAYLKSYKHMGRASVECLGGCSCGGDDGGRNATTASPSSPLVVDAHHDIWQTTVYLLPLAPKPLPDNNNKPCLIAITVLDGTSSPDRGHKFKVSGLMATLPLEGTLAQQEAERVRQSLEHEALQHERWLGQVNSGEAPAAEEVLKRRRQEEREAAAAKVAVVVAATNGKADGSLPRGMEAQRRAQQQQVLKEDAKQP
jgi:hypothetical protein